MDSRAVIDALALLGAMILASAISCSVVYGLTLWVASRRDKKKRSERERVQRQVAQHEHNRERMARIRGTDRKGASH